MREIIYWLLWRLVGWQSVLLIDFDGEIHARLVRGTRAWPSAVRMGFGIGRVLLLPGGRTRGACYVEGWVPLYPPPSAYENPDERNNVVPLRAVASRLPSEQLGGGE